MQFADVACALKTQTAIMYKKPGRPCHHSFPGFSCFRFSNCHSFPFLRSPEKAIDTKKRLQQPPPRGENYCSRTTFCLQEIKQKAPDFASLTHIRFANNDSVFRVHSGSTMFHWTSLCFYSIAPTFFNVNSFRVLSIQGSIFSCTLHKSSL